MRRWWLHIAFWLAYMLEDALMEFLWTGPALVQIPENQRFVLALQAAFVVLLPKILFSYYILYYAIDRIVEKKVTIFRGVVEVLVLLFICIVIYRVIFNYYVYPVIYKGIIKTYPLLDGRRLLFAMMDVGFIAGVMVAIKMVRIQFAGKEKEKNLVKEKLETELKFLRNQTNPHFLFNTLNNIYALARKKDDQAPEAVMKLSKLLRFMLYETGKEHITLAQEIKLMDDYIELEKLRYNERLTVRFNRSLDNEEELVAPLLLLPFVENAFKHGASETRFSSFIDIELSLQNGELHFVVKNTKDNDITTSNDQSIGLGNVKRQLELMYPQYNLIIDNQPTVFTVTLFINLRRYAKI